MSRERAPEREERLEAAAQVGCYSGCAAGLGGRWGAVTHRAGGKQACRCEGVRHSLFLSYCFLIVGFFPIRTAVNLPVPLCV